MVAIAPQVDHIVLIAHHVKIPETDRLHVINYSEAIPNISQMQNLGLDLAQYLGAETVAVLNDDAIVTPGWYPKILKHMEMVGAAAGWAAGEHAGHMLYTKAEPTLIRMTGYAYVVRSEMRVDEQFRWWYGDNDLEWRCREAGGVVHVGGSIEHRHPNGTTVGILAKIAGEDRERFRAKWGRLP